MADPTLDDLPMYFKSFTFYALISEEVAPTKTLAFIQKQFYNQGFRNLMLPCLIHSIF